MFLLCRYLSTASFLCCHVCCCWLCLSRRCGDAMELSLPEGSCDVAFSNWLLMYLGDVEVQQLAQNMLSWVGG